MRFITLMILFSIGAMSFAQAPETHPTLGTLVDVSPTYLKYFQPYLDKTMDLAKQLNTKQLPIVSSALLSEKSPNALVQKGPAFYFQSKTLVLDWARNDLEKTEAFAVPVHEIAHVVFIQQIMQKRNMTYEAVISRFPVSHDKAVAAFQELFADMFANFVLDDPDSMTRALALQDQRTQTPEQSAFNLEFKRQQRLERSSLQTTKAYCSISNPAFHGWFPKSRRYIWKDLYQNKFKSSDLAKAEILKALIEIGDGYLTDSRTRFETNYTAKKSNNPIVLKLNTDSDIPADFMDMDLLQKLQRRWP